ncbi:MAG: hypothetical protein ACREFX_06815 [Opitutaceae bacterium]
MNAPLLLFDSDARAKAKAFFDSLPAGARARWRSLDDFAATVMVAAVMQHPFPAAQVLDLATSKPLGADRVQIGGPGTGPFGLIFEKTEDGWKRVITGVLVDRYLARMRTASRPQPADD